MTQVLLVTTSLFGPEAQSARLSRTLLKRLRRSHGQLRVVHRDLTASEVPHLDALAFEAFGTPADERTLAQQAAVDRSDAFIEELKRADVVVLALPMYNFGVPSTFKAWFDHVARAGVTFAYTSEGPRGLLEDRPVYIISTRGGRYAGTPADLHSPYVRQILNFIGLEDLNFVYAEGLGSTAGREQALERANAEIRRLAA